MVEISAIPITHRGQPPNYVTFGIARERPFPDYLSRLKDTALNIGMAVVQKALEHKMFVISCLEQHLARVLEYNGTVHYATLCQLELRCNLIEAPRLQKGELLLLGHIYLVLICDFSPVKSIDRLFHTILLLIVGLTADDFDGNDCAVVCWIKHRLHVPG